MAEIFLTVDGGGTKTSFLLFSKQGEVLGLHYAGPSNPNDMDEASAAQAVAQGVRLCLQKAGIAANKVSDAVLFIPCFSSEMSYLRPLLKEIPLRQQDDFINALYGAFSKPYGIVAAAGTGSFAAGIGRDGQTAVAGGWGPLFGDGGSGYHIGSLALHAVARRQDMGKPPSLLGDLLLGALGLSCVEELRTAIYRPGFPRSKIASLALCTGEAAKQGDPNALEVFRQSTAALAGDVFAVAARLGEASPLVSLTGGIAKIGAPYRDPFLEALFSLLPAASYHPVKYPPLIGGALYILNAFCGLPIQDGALGALLEKGIAKAEAANPTGSPSP